MNNVIIARADVVASFDVDAQNTFTQVCPDELPVPNGSEIVFELNKQAKLADFRIGSKDAHTPKAIWIADDANPKFSVIEGEENVDVRWPLHAVSGTQGFALIDGLPRVTKYDFFIWKGIQPDMHPYGACYHDFAEKMSTGVIEYLTINQVTTIVVGGLATDYCVKQTVLQLLEADFRVIVNLGACRGISSATTKEAINVMKEYGSVVVNNSAEILIEE